MLFTPVTPIIGTTKNCEVNLFSWVPRMNSVTRACMGSRLKKIQTADKTGDVKITHSLHDTSMLVAAVIKL